MTFDLGIDDVRPFRVDVEARVALEPLQQVLERRRLGASDALAGLAVDDPDVLLAGQLVDLELGGVETTAALEALADVAADHFAQARQLQNGNTTPPSQHTPSLYIETTVSAT